MLALVLLIVAAVLFLLASIGVVKSPIHLGWLGAFFFALAFLVERL